METNVKNFMGDLPKKESRWAAPINVLDSPEFDPIPIGANHIVPITLDPPNNKLNGSNHWRRNIDMRNQHFDVQITNLDQAVTKNMIRNFFNANPVNIFLKAGTSKNSAIVSFRSKEDAQNALTLNGKVPYNCPQQISRLNITYTNSNLPLMDTPKAPRLPIWETPNTRMQPHNGPHNNQSFKSPHNNIANKINGTDYLSRNTIAKNNSYKEPFHTPTEHEIIRRPLTETPKRQPLNIQKRTKPIVHNNDLPPRNSAIFGQANPINDPVSIGLEPYHKENEIQTPKTPEKTFNKNASEAPTISTKPESQTDTPVDQSPSSMKPQRSFLRSGGDEIKKLINATHNTSSTSTKKNKENPYGEATPITVKEIPDTEEVKVEKSEANQSSNNQNSYSSNEFQPDTPIENKSETAPKKDTQTLDSESQDTSENTAKSPADSKSQHKTFESPSNKVTSPIISQTPSDSMKIPQPIMAGAKPKETSPSDNTSNDKDSFNAKKEFESEQSTKVTTPKAGESIWFLRKHHSKVLTQANETESNKKTTETPPTTSENTGASTAEGKSTTEPEAHSNKEITPKNGTNTFSDITKRYASPASYTKGRNLNRKNKEFTSFNRSETNSTSPQKQNPQHLQQNSTDKNSRNNEFNSRSNIKKPGSEKYTSDYKRFNYMMSNETPNNSSRGTMGIESRGQRNDTPSRAKDFRSSFDENLRRSSDSYNSKKPQNRFRTTPDDRERTSDKPSKGKTEAFKTKSGFSTTASSSYANTFPTMNSHKNTSNNEPSHVKTQNRYSLLNTDDN